MNNKRNLVEDYVIFVDTTKKQNTYFKIFLALFAIIVYLILMFFVQTPK